MKYVPGTRLSWNTDGTRGVVVPNYKLPGDVCVVWVSGLHASYDPEFLDKHTHPYEPISDREFDDYRKICSDYHRLSVYEKAERGTRFAVLVSVIEHLITEVDALKATNS